ncbi:hypothetical protein BC941DRAFT_433855 [Chlamydoabsidia padenii]|nr:hypothetical protein BC941DRAFT_433855 [Chlamydoabsidia padenii]
MPSNIPDKIPFKKLKPCQRCKVQRRKCDRSSEDVDCSRCIKSNRECINDDSGADIEDVSIDGNTELQRLEEKVASLQHNLQLMEDHLQHNSNNSNTLTLVDWEETALASWNQRYMVSKSICTPLLNNESQPSSYLHSNLPMKTATSSAFLSSASNDQALVSSSTGKRDDKDYQWDLTLVGGQLRLETSIRSFDELIAYGHALQKYLSPFSGVFDNTAFLFEQIQSQCLLPMTIQVISQTPPTSRRKTLDNGASMISKYHYVLKRHHTAVLLAAAGIPLPLSCIEEILQVYFTCINPALPMIHAPTYFAEYESTVRNDPNQHALTMAICSMVTSSTCRHLPYDNYERRILADYFYQRAVDLLVDFFDDPERRLETLIVINFLSQYQQITMRVTDARKWCTIGFMIANDLKKEYKQHQSSTPPTTPKTNDPPTPSSPSPVFSYPSPYSPSESQFSLPPSPTPSTSTATLISKLAKTTNDIDAALFSRHYTVILCFHKFMELIIERNPETREYMSSRPLLFVEDECETSYIFICAYNYALEFITHPVVLEMKEQVHRMHLGETAKVSLELILRFNQVYQDWWKSLPSSFRVCDQDPGDISCRPYIELCTSQIKLIVFIIATAYKVEANLALAKPSNQSSIAQDGNYQLVRAIQERALNEAYDCIESLIIAMKRVDSIMDYCIFASDLLLVISDLLCSLAASSSVSVKLRSKQKLMESLYDLQHVQFMQGNIVPPSMSPLVHMGSMTKSIISSPALISTTDLSPNILDKYNEYTFPCLAFGYDVIRKAFEDN